MPENAEYDWNTIAIIARDETDTVAANAARATLHTLHLQLARGYVCGRLPYEDAEEIASDADRKLLQAFDATKGSYISLARTAVRNAAISRIRRAANRVTLASEGTLENAIDPQHDTSYRAIDDRLDWEEELPESDLDIIRSWKTKIRIILLSRVDLWRKVPEDEWNTWLEEFFFVPPFQPPEHDDDLSELYELLAAGLHCSSNVVSVTWIRHRQKLLDLEFVKRRVPGRSES